VNIVCTIDDAYAQHCGAMLCSLFTNNPGLRLRTFLITNGVSQDARAGLDRVATASGRRIEWQQLDDRVFRRARISDHVSIATYFRVLIPDILPDDVDKVLFLDSDIIVRGSIRELYDQSVDAYTHAAVENPLATEQAERLGIAGRSYFNAGVLLLNLRRWRAERISEQVLDYINANGERLMWWDQDALNATLHGRWRACRPIWNAQEAFYKPHSAADLGVTTADLAEVRSNPRIVHFTGSRKPWSYYDRHPFKADYYAYLARTPWRGYQPFDLPSPRSRARQLVSLVAPSYVKQGYRRLASRWRPVSNA
jgi:lipopolysaccharide biosynthesis glycosyltransferase